MTYFKSISFLILSILCVTFFVVPESAAAQETETYRIETHDGNIFIGELISETDEQVTFRTESAGEITISRENIKRMTLLDDARKQNDEYWHENPQSTRYLFAPNALGIKTTTKIHGSCLITSIMASRITFLLAREWYQCFYSALVQLHFGLCPSSRFQLQVINCTFRQGHLLGA